MMIGTKKAKAFENVHMQIGACGIWCGSCVVGNGTLRELTKNYRTIIETYGLVEWGPKDINFEEFLKGLNSIQEMPLCPGCHKGGGRDDCEMKTCTSQRHINDCSYCSDIKQCENIDILQHMRSGALKAGLFVKAEDADDRALIEKWTASLKNTWPHAILFDQV
ncbi:DUF3795 domain-containing protein [candidate division CSSED10-310 bacterium]|uniref:DUF3795 domain-containing protein n=1 Tax=candidate division CSSED10-310 bacterium TaxID=2855610 RepID=A0ABV6Z050_UNCC1